MAAAKARKESSTDSADIVPPPLRWTQVLPREWGTRLHPLFFLDPAHWRRVPWCAAALGRLTALGKGGGRARRGRYGYDAESDSDDEGEADNEWREPLEGEWTTERDEDALLEAVDGGEAEVRCCSFSAELVSGA